MAHKENYFNAMFPPIDYNRVFTRIPEIMGLDLTFKKSWWEGAYYINGEPHKQRDKLKVKLQKGTIFAYEQGGDTLTLPVWLVKYGGCADYKAAYEVIRGGDRPVTDFAMRAAQRKKPPTLYVPRSDYEAMRQFDLYTCPLFRWFCGMFDKERVREVWDRYGVMTDGNHNTVYWYTDKKGRLCHENRISYMFNGHRDKERHAFRKYLTDKGYTGRCYFGEHLIANEKTVGDPTSEVLLTESEKDCLIITLTTGRTAIATGGKSNLREIGDNFVLLPDRDAADEWEQRAAGRGKICRWWEKYPLCGEHDGVGDYLIWRWKNRNRYE